MLRTRPFKLSFGVFLTVVFGLGAVTSSAWALKPGDAVSNVKVRDAEDEPASIPDLGSKVLALFYTDPDVKELNEPFRDALKAANLDKTVYRGLGIVNMKDTWKPDFAIRKVIRDKIKKFKSVILTDPDYILRDAWKLGDCDERDVVIIVGKDSRVKYLKMGRVGAAEYATVIALIQEEMKK
ncbi:MAG: YtfJ family protein [Myxococcota bacterium]